VILTKFRLCNFLITRYKPKNPKTKGIKIKNNCKFLSRFLKAIIGSPPASEIASAVIKSESGNWPRIENIITMNEPSKYFQNGFAFNVSCFKNIEL